MSTEFSNALSEMLVIQDQLQKLIHDGESVMIWFEKIRQLQLKLEPKLEQWKLQLKEMERVTAAYSSATFEGAKMLSSLFEFVKAGNINTENYLDTPHSPPSKRQKREDSVAQKSNSIPQVQDLNAALPVILRNSPILEIISDDKVNGTSKDITAAVPRITFESDSSSVCNGDLCQRQAACKGSFADNSLINADSCPGASTAEAGNTTCVVADSNVQLIQNGFGAKLSVAMTEAAPGTPQQPVAQASALSARSLEEPKEPTSFGNQPSTCALAGSINEMAVASAELSSPNNVALDQKMRSTNVAISSDNYLVIASETGTYVAGFCEAGRDGTFTAPIKAFHPRLVGPFKLMDVITISSLEYIFAIDHSLELYIQPLLDTQELPQNIQAAISPESEKFMKLRKEFKEDVGQLDQLNWTLLPSEIALTRIHNGYHFQAGKSCLQIMILRSKLISKPVFRCGPNEITMLGDLQFTGQTRKGLPYWITNFQNQKLLYRAMECKSKTETVKCADGEGSQTRNVTRYNLHKRVNIHSGPQVEKQDDVYVGNLNTEDGQLKPFWFMDDETEPFPYIYVGFAAELVHRTSTQTTIVTTELSGPNVTLSVYSLIAEKDNEGSWAVICKLTGVRTFSSTEIGLIAVRNADAKSEQFQLEVTEPIGVSGDKLKVKKHFTL